MQSRSASLFARPLTHCTRHCVDILCHCWSRCHYCDNQSRSGATQSDFSTSKQQHRHLSFKIRFEQQLEFAWMGIYFHSQDSFYVSLVTGLFIVLTLVTLQIPWCTTVLLWPVSTLSVDLSTHISSVWWWYGPARDLGPQTKQSFVRRAWVAMLVMFGLFFLNTKKHLKDSGAAVTYSGISGTDSGPALGTGPCSHRQGRGKDSQTTQKNWELG